MIYAVHGMESDVDVFKFMLAEKLHMTVGEVEDMSHMEYVRWSAYLTAKGMQDEARR